MNNKFYEIIRIQSSRLPIDDLYLAGMINVKENIEFYVDKTYTCESVIQELFRKGVKNYIERKKED